MLNLTKIQTRTDYVDEVYESLLDAISDGTLAPGERITQEDLAERLNVSRSPVLQALRLLKKDGLLQDAPGRGLVVTPLDPTWIGHLYQVRGALDALAAQLAAQRRAVIPKTLIDRGRAAAAGDDVRALIEADVALHTAIYEASANPLIIDTARLHWTHLRRVMGAVLQQRAGRSGIWDEHEALCEAIARGDEVLAAELSRGHTAQAREVLMSQLENSLMVGRAKRA